MINTFFTKKYRCIKKKGLKKEKKKEKEKKKKKKKKRNPNLPGINRKKKEKKAHMYSHSLGK